MSTFEKWQINGSPLEMKGSEEFKKLKKKKNDHSLLFVIKATRLDRELRKPLGTVYCFGREYVQRTCLRISDENSEGKA